MGLNADSPHKEEAREFLEWMTTSECAELLGNELPGFFPMHRNPPTLSNEHANAFLALNEGRGTDVRFAWEKLRDGSPDGYALMQDGAMAVLRGEQTPQEAADALQAGLAKWFEPAQECGP
jgi:raffinose/stachyose/melibiose transport system substrate-binding protein